MTYVIHGATGAQGAPVVSALTAAGEPVVALTRRADADVTGARVIATDLSSVEALTEVYRGAAGVFVHLPMASEELRLDYARNIAAAVAKARPARVVISTSGATGASAAGEGEDPVAVLIRGVADTGVSHAVAAPRLFLENLLLPPVLEGVRADAVLRYPLDADQPISWASHLDVADAVAALFARPEVTGVVEVGHHPALTGSLLAEGFAAHFGTQVTYQALTPADFGAALTPLFGEVAAAGVAEHYRLLGEVPDHAIEPGRSAQQLLGTECRTVGEWLAAVGV
ncbi:NmrA family NAD(P)-binding protein [Streptomyces sp. NPDC048636]|uniref:NmrA family NAD(P)-binding protein n=1 Tax=Streptomyces sp. NPDC048636 TaxID=3155762 RepID=UPI0034155814